MPHEGLYCVKEEQGVCLTGLSRGKPGEGLVGPGQKIKICGVSRGLLKSFKFAEKTERCQESDGEKTRDEIKLRGGQNRV